MKEDDALRDAPFPDDRLQGEVEMPLWRAQAASLETKKPDPDGSGFYGINWNYFRLKEVGQADRGAEASIAGVAGVKAVADLVLDGDIAGDELLHAAMELKQVLIALAGGVTELISDVGAADSHEINSADKRDEVWIALLNEVPIGADTDAARRAAPFGAIQFTRPDEFELRREKITIGTGEVPVAVIITTGAVVVGAAEADFLGTLLNLSMAGDRAAQGNDACE